MLIVNGQDPDGLVEILNDHVHSAQGVYPTLAGGATVTGGAAWTLGNYAEVVPNAQIGASFDLHWLWIENVSADTRYELVLYGVTTEIARARFARDVAGSSTEPLISIPVQTVILAAGTQIQAKLASAAGGGETATVSVGSQPAPDATHRISQITSAVCPFHRVSHPSFAPAPPTGKIWTKRPGENWIPGTCRSCETGESTASTTREPASTWTTAASVPARRSPRTKKAGSASCSSRMPTRYSGPILLPKRNTWTRWKCTARDAST